MIIFIVLFDNFEVQIQVFIVLIDLNKLLKEFVFIVLFINFVIYLEEQKEVIKEEYFQVIKREVEKIKVEERDLKGEKLQGMVVVGFEDDCFWVMF